MTDRRNRISAILCAYTLARWRDIGEAIASLRSQTRPPDEIILVVDHNPDLLARAAAAFPDLTVLANRHRPGLSGGRNTGIEASHGDLVAFFDDDAVAEADWLERLERLCANEGVLGATGAVHPAWSGAKPGWFPDEFLWTVGCSFAGAEALADGEVRNLMGGAMMLRRDVFRVVGGFDADLGRTEANANLLSCEETELCIRARAAFPEGRFLSDPSAAVWHKVGASRLTVGYFCRRTYAEGLSKARVAALAGRSGSLNTEQGYALRLLGRSIPRNLGAGLVRFDRYAFARAGAIVLGLTCAALGFAHGKRMWPAQARRREGGAPIPVAASGPVPGPAAAPLTRAQARSAGAVAEG